MQHIGTTGRSHCQKPRWRYPQACGGYGSHTPHTPRPGAPGLFVFSLPEQLSRTPTKPSACEMGLSLLSELQLAS